MNLLHFCDNLWLGLVCQIQHLEAAEANPLNWVFHFALLKSWTINRVTFISVGVDNDGFGYDHYIRRKIIKWI